MFSKSYFVTEFILLVRTLLFTATSYTVKDDKMALSSIMEQCCYKWDPDVCFLSVTVHVPVNFVTWLPHYIGGSKASSNTAMSQLKQGKKKTASM